MILLTKKPDWLIEAEKRGERLRASRLRSQKRREKTMKLKMKETVKGASDPSGTQAKEYQEGETYEVHESLGKVFLKEKWAEKAKGAAPENKAKGKAPENKAKK
jgi:hypothetical protein